MRRYQPRAAIRHLQHLVERGRDPRRRAGPGHREHQERVEPESTRLLLLLHGKVF